MSKRNVLILGFFLCLIVAGILYYSGSEPFLYYLAIAASVLQIAGIGVMDFYSGKQAVREKNAITVKRTYLVGPVDVEEIIFSGSEALERYVNGMSKLLPERSVPASNEIVESIKLLNEGKNDEAGAQARAALGHLQSPSVNAPKHILSQAYMILGDIEFSKGNYLDAENYYNLVQNLSKSFDDGFLNLASLHGLAATKGRQGDHQEALRLNTQLIGINPSFSSSWYNKGSALFTLGRPDEALESFDKAIELNPENDRAWNNRGVALRGLGRPDEALESYDKAIELNPENDRAWYNRGVALGNLGRHEEALISHDKAIELKPDHEEAWIGRGDTLEHLGRFKEALEAYNKAIELKPDDEEAWKSKKNIIKKMQKTRACI